MPSLRCCLAGALRLLAGLAGLLVIAAATAPAAAAMAAEAGQFGPRVAPSRSAAIVTGGASVSVAAEGPLVVPALAPAASTALSAAALPLALPLAPPGSTPTTTSTAPGPTRTTTTTTPTSPAPTTTTPRNRHSGPTTNLATGLFINGAGDGHGIGMSQYGALGLALHGYSYSRILAHYYGGTTIGTVARGQTVSVLLRTGRAAFSGANSANRKPLDPTTTYTVAVKGAQLQLLARGKPPITLTPPVLASGPGPLLLVGLGSYRGSLVFRPAAANKIQTVNLLGLEDYVRGVVAGEMPSNWPMPALEAQAIAARTYVLTDQLQNGDFDVYDDTRSQMYGGVKDETPATDAAVDATTGQVVEYAGSPATTYFFASSGGHTEDIQNVWTGVAPEAWLQGVPDPYDDSGGNPFYRWRVDMSLARAQRKLHGLVLGSLVGIEVRKRGVSPRIVTAAVVGTDGSTLVTGVQLEQALGLRSTYLSFTTITAKGTTRSGSVSNPPASTTPATTTPAPPPTTTTTPASSTGGSGLSVAPAPAPAPALRSAAVAGARREATTTVSGTIFPARRGVRIVVKRLGRHRLTAIARGRTIAGGAYYFAVPGPGRYRVFVGSTAGPVVEVP